MRQSRRQEAAFCELTKAQTFSDQHLKKIGSMCPYYSRYGATLCFSSEKQRNIITETRSTHTLISWCDSSCCHCHIANFKFLVKFDTLLYDPMGYTFYFVFTNHKHANKLELSAINLVLLKANASNVSSTSVLSMYCLVLSTFPTCKHVQQLTIYINQLKNTS